MMRTYLNLFFFLSFSLFEGLVQADSREFTIGVTAPLSGGLASVGQEIIRGIELGKEDFSNADMQFSLKAEDDQFSGKLAIGNAKKLIEVDKVDAIISLWDMAEIVAPIAEQSKIPHFAIRWNPHVAEKYAHTITVESTYKSYIKSFVELLEYEKVSSIGLILEEAEGWSLGAKELKRLLASTSIRLLAEEHYVRGDVDYRGIVQRVLRKNPERILLFSNPPNVEPLIKRIKEVRPEQKFSGYFEILEHPEVAEGMTFVAQLHPEDWFIKKYQNKYGAKIKSRAPQSYDIVALIAEALKKKGVNTSGTEVVEFLSHIQGFQGASGELAAKGTRTIEMDCVWKKIHNGRFVLVR